jgi:glutamyl-tRNA reductase
LAEPVDENSRRFATNLPVVCVSFRHVPIGMRERVARGLVPHEAVCSHMWRSLGAHWVVVTCHRVEIYLHLVSFQSAQDIAQKLLQVAGLECNLASKAWVYRGWEAARHGLEVAAGLDSAMLGEEQIFHQMVDSARAHANAGCLDGFLDSFARRVCKGGLRIRERSGLSAYRNSLGQAAADYLLARLKVPLGRKGIVVGTGTVAQDVLRRLSGTVGRLYIAGRRSGRAERLASRYSAIPIALSQALELLPMLDFAVFALHLPRPLAVDAQALPEGFVLLDLGMPRNIVVETSIGSRITYCDVDQLPLRVKRDSLEAVVERARDCVMEELSLLSSWHRKTTAAPNVAVLYRWAGEVVNEELERSRTWLLELGEVHRAQVRQLAQSLAKKLLAKPMAFMQRDPVGGPESVLSIFGLELVDEKVKTEGSSDRLYG